MLLEYTQDTEELELHNRAIELRRRVAGRKLDQALKIGVVGEDGLIELKEANRQVRNTHFEETAEIIHAEVNERVALTRANQHLRAEGQLRKLERDLSRASRLGKSRFDALDDLEKRLKNMRSLLHNPTDQTVESIISKDLYTDHKQIKLEKNFENCEHCNKRILVQLLDSHKRMCLQLQKAREENDNRDPLALKKVLTAEEEAEKRRQMDKEKLQFVYDVNETLITSLATFRPNPPRNCKLLRKSITFLEWTWEPPVINGGLEITDYEVSYHVQKIEFDHKLKKYRKWEEDVILTTSHWCFIDQPVAHHGYKMCNLRANSICSNFRIRCYNLRGWSEYAPMLNYENEKVVLDPEVPPTAPLFVNCDKITSTCLYLSWSPPYFDGGLPVIEYIIHFTVVEIKQTVTERALRKDIHLSYSTESSVPSTVIRNLPDDTDIINIYIVAKNQGQLLGANGHCKQATCRTLKCSRYTQLQRELEITLNTDLTYVDSDFFTVRVLSLFGLSLQCCVVKSNFAATIS
jgi:hypothetical protein